MGRCFEFIRTRDERGREIRTQGPTEQGVVFSVVHFVELDDGRRLTTERLGEISLEVPRACTVLELEDDVRELIFEEEMREAVGDELADEPRWDAIVQVLSENGVSADEAALASLPFVVELDDSVVSALKG